MNDLTKQLLGYIIEQACLAYGVHEADFYGQTRVRPVPEARQMAWTVVTTVIPYNEINISNLARHCNRTHSNVITGIKRINGICEIEEKTKKIKEILVLLAKKRLFCITDNRQNKQNPYRPTFLSK